MWVVRLSDKQLEVLKALLRSEEQLGPDALRGARGARARPLGRPPRRAASLGRGRRAGQPTGGLRGGRGLGPLRQGRQRRGLAAGPGDAAPAGRAPSSVVVEALSRLFRPACRRLHLPISRSGPSGGSRRFGGGSRRSRPRRRVRRSRGASAGPSADPRPAPCSHRRPRAPAPVSRAGPRQRGTGRAAG